MLLQTLEPFTQNSNSAQIVLLKQELEYKDKILKNIPNEFKAYITSIIGFSGLLLEAEYNTLTAKQKYYLNNIIISAGLINKSLKDIQDLY